MSNKWIFFDLGSTLVDEGTAHYRRLAQTAAILRKHGREYSVDSLVELCEKAATEYAPAAYWGMIQGLKLPPEVALEIEASAKYRKEDEHLYNGVPELLRSLASRTRLGIIANQSAGTERRLDRWGVRSHFEVVLASNEMGLSKPDRAIFDAAVARTGCAASEALMVGDRIDNDIGPAKLQGWNTCRVLTGFYRFQIPRAPHEQPDLTVDAATHVEAAIEAWR